MIDFAHLEPLVRAVLYEGYVLYPYRATALKNRYRWTFGGVYPRAFCDGNPGERSWARTETLMVGTGQAVLAGSVRFLHLREQPGTADGPPLQDAPWQEAVERTVAVAPVAIDALLAGPTESRFEFGPGAVPGQARQRAVRGKVVVAATGVGSGAYRISVAVYNETSGEERAHTVGAHDSSAGDGTLHGGAVERMRAAMCSLASMHVLLGVQSGRFCSLVDPPPELHAAADACSNVGLWPVLGGPPGRHDTVLASPIILGDHPAVAEESPGDFFDGTEIDEMLALRVLTLTDAERREARVTDARARALLDRIDALEPEALLRLHGRLREVRTEGTAVAAGGSAALRPGARVRLRPKGRADIFDLALSGRDATVASVERDFEGRLFVTVTVDDDPGRDLGLAGQPGHRFFFRADEVEALHG